MNKTNIEIVNFAIGLPKNMTYDNEKVMNTGICKDKVDEAFLTKEGFLGDGVGDLKHHGGLDRAVCVYPHEHYSLWEKEFNTSLPPAAFGENLTVINMLEQDVHIGDIFQLGEAVIQITQGRIPCDTINKRTNIHTLLKRIVETGYTGYLCRVLKEGTVTTNSKLELIERHSHQVSVLFGNQLYFHQPTNIEGIKKVLAVKELANRWREKLTNRLHNLSK